MGGKARSRKSRSLQVVNETLDYLALAVAVPALSLTLRRMILADLEGNTRLLADCLQERLPGRLAFVPQIAVSELGHRVVALAAIMMVLDATTSHPFSATHERQRCLPDKSRKHTVQYLECGWRQILAMV
jgi:hypothetical protein